MKIMDTIYTLIRFTIQKKGGKTLHSTVAKSFNAYINLVRREKVQLTEKRSIHTTLYMNRTVSWVFHLNIYHA